MNNTKYLYETMIAAIIAYAIMAVIAGSALAYGTAEEQFNRLKTPATVCLKGEACDTAMTETVATTVSLPGEAKYAVCAACHGADGGGGVGPAMQEQTAEAISEMLYAYKAGETRGAQSALMWGQAAGLSDQDIADLSEYIATL